MAYDKLPHKATIPLRTFQVSIPQAEVYDLKNRLKNTRPFKRTFENSGKDEYFGVNLGWMEKALEIWRDEYDWRETEKEINSHSNYIAELEHRGHKFDLHFIAFFSEKSDAVPIIMTHGWPGSIIEFLPLLRHLQSEYTPATLPAHIIIPSLIGYGFSGPPPLDIKYGNADQAILQDKLMLGLGFEKYIAQGGDIGGFVTFKMGNLGKGCKAVHLNFCPSDRPEGFDDSTLDSTDQALVKRQEKTEAVDMSYRDEHALKPATIGFVCDSDPIALLAWIAEKFLIWTDDDLPIPTILADVSVYWFTHCFSTAMWHYRASYGRPEDRDPNDLMTELREVPVGYSQFPKELFPSPAVWVKEKVDLVWHRRHDKGGHFAALEVPDVLWKDVMDFVGQVWKP